MLHGDGKLFTYICKPVGTLWDLPSQFRTHSQDFSRVHITRWGDHWRNRWKRSIHVSWSSFWHCSSWWHRSICQRYGSITHFSTCRRTSNISHAGTSAIQHCGILRTQVGSISLSATSSGTRTDSAAAAMTVTFFSSHSQRTLQTSSKSLYYSTWKSLLAIEPHALQSQCLKHQNKQTNQPTWCVCSTIQLTD